MLLGSLFEHTSFKLGSIINMTRAVLEHVKDADTYLLFVKGMLSIASYISVRQKKTNKKYLKSYE